jgi:hypothetical protein
MGLGLMLDLVGCGLNTVDRGEKGGIASLFTCNIGISKFFDRICYSARIWQE